MTEQIAGQYAIAAQSEPRVQIEPDNTSQQHRLVDISPAKLFGRRVIRFRGITVESVQATTSARIDYRYRNSMHLLAVWQHAARNIGETFVEGLPRSTLRTLTHKLTFVPAGHQYHDWHEPTGPTRVMFFYVDPSAVPPPDAVGNISPSLTPRLLFEDKTLWETALKLQRAFEHEDVNDTSYFNAVGAVLAHELSALHCGAFGRKAQLRGGLAGRQQRIVKAYIGEHLTENIPLSTLAHLVQLSPSHFCRAFKESFGMSAHRYHTRLRIERAKALLQNGAPSITDIGLDLGFCDSSAFTKTFRKETGTTPTRYCRGLD